MKRAIYGCLAFTMFAVALLCAAESGDSSFTVQVPGGDKMLVTPPAGWKYTIDHPPAGLPPTADLSTPGGMILKVSFMKDPKGLFVRLDELEKIVTKSIQRDAANSVEKRVVLQRFAAKSGFGVYSVFTHPGLAGGAKPLPRDFRYVSSGALSLGRQVLIFSALSNNKDNDEYRQAFDFLANGISVAPDGT